MEDIKRWASELPTTLASFYGDLSSNHIDLTERVSQAGYHTFHSVRLWGCLFLDFIAFLLFHTLSLLSWLFHFTRPLVAKGANSFKKLDLFTQLSIGAGFALVVLLWLTQRWIVRRRFLPRLSRWYQEKRQAASAKLLATQAQVGEHSRVLAAMLPHLAMFGISGLIIYLVPHYLDQIVNAWPLYALGIVWPIVSCTRAILRDDQWKMSLWLEYAIVAYFAVFISMLPFSQTAISFTPLFSEVRFFFILWLLLPVTRGSHLTFRKVLWVLRRLSIPGFHDLPVPPSPVREEARAHARRPRARGARRGGGARGENAPVGFMGRVNAVVNTVMTQAQRVGRVGPLFVETLVLQGIVTREFANRVLALRRDNIYQLVLLVGSLLSPVSLIGYLALGILFPMRQSILMLADEDMLRVKFWLQYWTTLALLSPVYSYFIPYLWFVPFKGSLTLIGILVLQFTDYPLEPIHKVFSTIIMIFEGIFRPQLAQRRGAPERQRRGHENHDELGRGGNDSGGGGSGDDDHAPALPPPGPDEFSLAEPAVSVQPSNSRGNPRRSLRRRRGRRRSGEDSPPQNEQDGVDEPLTPSGAPEDPPASVAPSETKDNVMRQVHDGALQQRGDAICEQDERHVLSNDQSSTNQSCEVLSSKESVSTTRQSENECDGGSRNTDNEMKSNDGDEQSENPEELGSQSSDSDYVADSIDLCHGDEGVPTEGMVVNKSQPARRSKRIRQKLDNGVTAGG